MRRPPKRQPRRSSARRKPAKRSTGGSASELADLRARLTEAEETLEAIRSGGVDAIVVAGDTGEQVFTLKGADHRYRRLVETMTEGAATLSTAGIVLYANQEIAQMLGRPLQKVLGATFPAFMAPSSARTFEALLRVAKTGPAKGEVTLIDAYGHEVPAFVSANANDLEDELGFSLIVTDLRQQKRSEEMVAFERLAISILDQVAEPLVVCDPQGRIIRASQASHELAGRNLLFEPFASLPLRIDGESPAELLARVLGGAAVTGLDASFERPGAEPVGVQVSARALHGDGGEVLGCVASIVDITEHKRAEGRLMQSVRIRDEFLSVAGHELKTPLTALLLQIQSIRRVATGGATLPPERLAERLEKLIRHVRRLERLINELLDVSRITAGRLTLEREEIELTGLVSEIVDRFAEELTRAGCVLTITAPDAVSGQWDRMRLDQVFTNVVSNAIKYGAGKPIEIVISSTGSLARVAVKDHGIGISDADSARLFGRFERAVSERHYGGFGLGLWISRQIVEALDGTIRFESQAGVGTTFIIELPSGTGASA